MFTAIMEYHFKPEFFEQACEIWKNEVVENAKNQEGFVRMQLLTRDNQFALAIGTWEAAEYAQAFMRTGIFTKLLDQFKKMLIDKPAPVIWETKIYAEIEK